MVLAQIYGSRNYEEAMACAAAGAGTVPDKKTADEMMERLETPTVL